MISRIADHCFWLGRYIERAESTARVLHVTGNLALDAELTEAQCFRPILVVAEQEAHFTATAGEDATTGGEAVQHYMTWRDDNPVSLVQSITYARENARSIREVLSLEVWQTINELYLWVAGASSASDVSRASIAEAAGHGRGHPDDGAGGGRRAYVENRHGFYRRVRQLTELTLGLLQSTMLHDTPLDFIILGVMLERASQTARTLDMHRFLFPSLPDAHAHPVVETALWLSLLRACSGFEPFMKRNRGRVAGEAVAAFLLLEPAFPRSVRHCIASACERLDATRSPAMPGLPGGKVQDRLRLLEEWLIEMTPESLKKEAVHEALARVVTEVDLACSAIGEELLGGGPAPGALEGTQSMRAG